MKKIYLIQYKTEDHVLENRIKSLGNWFKYFSDNWIVETDKSAQDLYKFITENLNERTIFIIELKPNNYYGRMDPKLWKFIKDHKKSGE